MEAQDVFWRLEALSDRQLLERASSVLGSSRRLMAELVAQLGEVEERRLHLAAACSSMFAYCLKLGMTEDEAYRRIEVARLARRYPAIFPLLANGQLSISVVALLKHHLSVDNHLDLLAAVRGKSVGQARELIAARYPRPDVASSLRKLPERRTPLQPSLVASEELVAGGTESSFVSTVTELVAGGTESSFVSTVTELVAGEMESGADGKEAAKVAGSGDPTRSASALEVAPGSKTAVVPAASQHGVPRPMSSRIEPLSAHRYKVQLTASVELARKLELARDLMRHTNPTGELGPILERAVDLLIESLMQRRFGKRKAASRAPTSGRTGLGGAERRDAVVRDRPTLDGAAQPDTALHTVKRGTVVPGTAEPGTRSAALTTLETAEPGTTTLDTVNVHGDRGGELERASGSSYIPRVTRRTVVERDGLGCSWADEHGVRCGSRAWLEFDHRRPRAKGGGAEPGNVRLLCRHHNRWAAEREYGRRHVERAVAERRRQRRSPAI